MKNPMPNVAAATSAATASPARAGGALSFFSDTAVNERPTPTQSRPAYPSTQISKDQWRQLQCSNRRT
jgi:hypothetical protein